MSLRKVDYMTARHAAMIAGNPAHGFISLTDADKETKLNPGQWGAFLHLAVDDITIARTNWVLFDATHAAAIIAWLDEHAETLTTIHVHCHQARGRSPAVARFIAERYGIDLHVPTMNEHIYNVLSRVAAGREGELGP